MIEMKDGNVVVIRDGDFVEAIYYREFYNDISELVDQVIEYLNAKKFDEPNLSYMQVVDGNFVVLENDNDFFNEFENFARIFNFATPTCDNCGHLTFIYLDKTKKYCHHCKTVTE